MRRVSRLSLDSKDRISFIRTWTDHLGVLATPLQNDERATLMRWLRDFKAFEQLEFSADTSPDMLWTLAEMFRVSIAVMFCYRIEEAAYWLLGRERSRGVGYDDPELYDAVARVVADPAYGPFLRTSAEVFSQPLDEMAKFIASGGHEDHGMHFVGYQGEIRDRDHTIERLSDGMYRLGDPPRPYTRRRGRPFEDKRAVDDI